MKLIRAKANRVLPKDCTCHNKDPLRTTQEKALHMGITRYSIAISVSLYSLQPNIEKFFTVSKNKTGADCGSDHELLIATFRCKWEKVGKTTRLLRYDRNQIPYDYTVEVRNRFKGLDLTDRAPEELWTEVHDTVQERGIRPPPRKRKIYPFECRVPKNSKDR